MVVSAHFSLKKYLWVLESFVKVVKIHLKNHEFPVQGFHPHDLRTIAPIPEDSKMSNVL